MRIVGSAGAACAGLALVACGGSAHPRASTTTRPAATTAASSTSSTPTPTTTTSVVAKPKPPPPPSYPRLLPAALGTAPTPSVRAVRWKAQTVAWITRLPSGVAMMTFKQPQLELHLHSGTIDAGTLGWRYGPSIGGFELARMVAAFNGGFRLSTGAGGFESYGREAAPLSPGRASIVTYADGSSNIGRWGQEVPAPRKRVVSVRQNLTLLIDHSTAAANLDCLDCWGSTLGGVADPARSALGITAGGRLVWAGGEKLTVSALASALLRAHAVRAAELDINPEWVAGYFYGHRGGRGPLAPVPALPTQHGIPGDFLAPWSRDFFTIVAR